MKVLSVDFVVDDDSDEVLDDVVKMCEWSGISLLSWTTPRDLTADEIDLAKGLGITQDGPD